MSQRPQFITDLSLKQLESLLITLKQPTWRAKTIFSWVYQKKASSFEAFTDLPKALRKELTDLLTFSSVNELEKRLSADGSRKVLFELWDEQRIESALIPSIKGQHTVCVSSQVGCAGGCPFCATGNMGYKRNLGISEICDQVLYFAARLEEGQSIGNIVFMGMGEPLANYLDVLQATERLNASWGFGLGARNITLSTAGHIPGIQKLAREKLQLGLAVSLHAADNALRSKLVPLNRKYPLDKLIPVCDAYVKESGRRVTFEYCLFAGVNDSLEQARELAHLLRGLNCHVNLISSNSPPNSDWKAPSKEVVEAFRDELLNLHIVVSLRRSMGRDIGAACGQLGERT